MVKRIASADAYEYSPYWTPVSGSMDGGSRRRQEQKKSKDLPRNSGRYGNSMG